MKHLKWSFFAKIVYGFFIEIILNELQNILSFPLANKAFKELTRIFAQEVLLKLLSPLTC